MRAVFFKFNDILIRIEASPLTLPGLKWAICIRDGMGQSQLVITFIAVINGL